MSFTALVNGVQRPAEKGLHKSHTAVCHTCGEPVIARCGSQVTHHWAHVAKSDCPGAAMTVWHYGWQRQFPLDQIERRDLFTGKIPDVIVELPALPAPLSLPADAIPYVVIEFQHSGIDEATITARERVYDNVVWVVDVRGRKSLTRGASGTWYWQQPWEVWMASKRRVYFQVTDTELVCWDNRPLPIVVPPRYSPLPPLHTDDGTPILNNPRKSTIDPDLRRLAGERIEATAAALMAHLAAPLLTAYHPVPTVCAQLSRQAMDNIDTNHQTLLSPEAIKGFQGAVDMDTFFSRWVPPFDIDRPSAFTRILAVSNLTEVQALSIVMSLTPALLHRLGFVRLFVGSEYELRSLASPHDTVDPRSVVSGLMRLRDWVLAYGALRSAATHAYIDARNERRQEKQIKQLLAGFSPKQPKPASCHVPALS